jgi:ribosome-associated protein
MAFNLPEPELPEERLAISVELAIPLAELHFRFSRSGGPGGQHVNRSETRVELLFDVARSPSLTEAQRARILHRLAGYIDGTGVLRVVSTATRSQAENRADAMARFRALVSAALRRRKRRIPTRPSAAARERRLAEKRTRAGVKAARRRVDRDEYE